MKELIIETRNLFLRRNGKFGFFERKYNKLEVPAWIKEHKDTRFDAIYRDQDVLFTDGSVVFSYIVQANSQLFEPGKTDCPAAIIFSEDQYFDENQDELANIAAALYQLKGEETDDAELRQFAEVITNEMTALYNVKLPMKITNNKEVYYSTIMVHRKHLPLGYLKSTWLPILTYPLKTEASIILPSKYWVEGMREIWIE
jgi:ribonuclease HI